MVQKVFDLPWTKVTDSYIANFAIFNETFHGTPCVAVIDILATKVSIRNRPVHVIEIEICGSKLSKTFINGFVDFVHIAIALLANYLILGWMAVEDSLMVIPELTRDP